MEHLCPRQTFPNAACLSCFSQMRTAKTRYQSWSCGIRNTKRPLHSEAKTFDCVGTYVRSGDPSHLEVHTKSLTLFLLVSFVDGDLDEDWLLCDIEPSHRGIRLLHRLCLR